MKLKEITIENFRGIRSLDLSLDDLTVLIGKIIPENQQCWRLSDWF